jgi:hypothetical protein
MAYTHNELKHKTLAELREIAKDIEHLVVALCQALGIDMHEHHVVVGIDKASIKAQLKAMKKKRDEALAAHDHAQLKVARRTMHRLKRRIHKATV